MLAFKEFRSKNVGVYGLGITGLSIAETLKFNGANVYIWDDNPIIREQFEKKDYILMRIKAVSYTHLTLPTKRIV